MRECGGGNARLLETGYGIDGFGPGRWLVSLRDRQIVKSTAIADWHQKAGSWSAQRGGGVEWTGVGREGVGVGGRTSRSRVLPARFSVTGAARVKGLTSLDAPANIRLDPNLVLRFKLALWRHRTRALCRHPTSLCPFLPCPTETALMLQSGRRIRTGVVHR